MAILLLIVGLILFVGLVVVHEWGHFMVARRNGVVAEEFGIFFPPRLWKHKTKAGWLFTLNALPLGGFVKLKGEHDTDTEKGSFGAASLWVKTKIMAAGVFMNLVTALVLFTILALVGLPKLVNNQFSVRNNAHLLTNEVLITYIEPGSPAARAGFKPTDQITAIRLPEHSPVAVTSANALPDITKHFAGMTVDVFYVRAGHEQQARLTLRSQQAVAASIKAGNQKGYLGISPSDYSLERYTWSAPIEVIGFSAQVTALTFQGLGHALGGLGSTIAGALSGNHTARENGQTQATSQLAGPVGIFYILKTGSLLGYQFMLLIVAIISLTLAIMNILPIPALDGGRLWIMLITRGLKRPLSAQKEEAINAIGFALLITLVILITIVDVKRGG